MKVHCRTNLDIHMAEKWPTELPCVPRVGDYIVSAYRWGQYRPEGGNPTHFVQLELQVCGVKWEANREGEWTPTVELHLPKHRFENILEFSKWYSKMTGRMAC